jgi:hypothetical protein
LTIIPSYCLNKFKIKEGANPQVANLNDKRFVLASEPDHGELNAKNMFKFIKVKIIFKEFFIVIIITFMQ